MIWALKWRSINRLDGLSEHLIFEHQVPKLFRTRAEARAWRDKHYGFIRTRADLKAEPHGWRLPIPVKVEVVESDMNLTTGPAARQVSQHPRG